MDRNVVVAQAASPPQVTPSGRHRSARPAVHAGPILDSGEGGSNEPAHDVRPQARSEGDADAQVRWTEGGRMNRNRKGASPGVEEALTFDGRRGAATGARHRTHSRARAAMRDPDGGW
jgi:hypothetical protein